jgi:2-(1,2-epoxy-1,2-dihydrophenyl)acetyl-CoA isomerase
LTTTTDDVLLETVADGVAVLTLNRPDSLNALDTRLMRELVQALARLADDDAVRCVVLTGAGRAFSSGGDMKASKAANEARAKAGGAPVPVATTPVPTRQPPTFEKRVAWLRRSAEASRLLYTMRKPTIAMIKGACAGAGLSLAGACDLRIAGESAVFTTAFIRAGISGDYGGSWFWTRILGTGRARELFLLGDKIGARQAMDYGMITRLVPDAELEAATMELAARIANGPASTYGYLKENLAAAELLPLEAALDQEGVRMMLSRDALMAARAAAKRAEAEAAAAAS